MPSQLMDNHPISPSPYFSPFPSHQKHLGFTQPHIFTNHYGIQVDARPGALCSLPYASVSPLQMDSLPAKEQLGADEPVSHSSCFWASMGLCSGTTTYHPNLESSWDESHRLSSYCENGLFSTSLNLSNTNFTLSPNNALYENSIEPAATHHEEEETFESSEEIEAQTIGNLLPSDDDLFSGVIDGVQCISQRREEEDDLFSSVGGMNLGHEASFGGYGQWGWTNVSTIEKHPYVEHPSRTLFVRNINNNVEDSELRALFEQYGDVQTLYTACKLRGFIMISYYDIRAARNAMQSLQNKPLRHKRLNIHYSFPKDNPSNKDVNPGTLVVFNLDSSVSNDDVHKIFGAYGEIKDIRETPQNGLKIIEFYDVRAADESLRALNWSEIAGKNIQIEPSVLGTEKWSSMLPLHQELGLDEDGFCLPLSSAGLLHGSVKGTSVKGGIGLGTNVGSRAATGLLKENSLRYLISSSVPCGLPSNFGVESIGKQPRVSGSHNSASQFQYDLQALQNRLPHSLPEYSGGVPTVSHNDYLSASISSLPSESVENLLKGKMCTGLNSSGHANAHLAGHQYLWSNLNQSQPPTFMWPNSPSFSNRFCAHQPHGLARSTANMLNSISPVSGPQVGSAPNVNRSIWEEPCSSVGGSPESSSLNQGSVRSMKISDSHMHHVNFPSCNMSPHIGGNCMDLPNSFRDVGPHSFQHPNRSQMNMGGSLETRNVRSRSRRNDNSSSQSDNKLYELDVDRIRRGEDNRTTLMIKNIPNKYTSKMLMAAIDEHHRGAYDFIYLPIDFKNKCNVGYAFINMLDPSHILAFYETFNGKKWEKFNSEKVASLAYARIQGKMALITHFQNSSLMNEDKRCRPILFHGEGPNIGDQVPFPMGVNVRSRADRSRFGSNGDGYGEKSSHSNKDESSSSSSE